MPLNPKEAANISYFAKEILLPKAVHPLDDNLLSPCEVVDVAAILARNAFFAHFHMLMSG